MSNEGNFYEFGVGFLDRTNSKAMVIVFGPVFTFSRIRLREGKKGGTIWQ